MGAKRDGAVQGFSAKMGSLFCLFRMNYDLKGSKLEYRTDRKALAVDFQSSKHKSVEWRNKTEWKGKASAVSTLPFCEVPKWLENTKREVAFQLKLYPWGCFALESETPAMTFKGVVVPSKCPPKKKRRTYKT